MKAGIAIDAWKLPIFERHLKAGGYTFESGAGLTADTLLLTVHIDRPSALAQVALAANTEAAKTGRPQ